MIVNSSKMNFKDTVDDILRNGYYPDVVKVTLDTIPKVARKAARRLKETSPKRPGIGKYASGWAVDIEKGRAKVGATVYGKHGTYQLAHLLEYGHATRNGTGRVYPPTPAHPHIEAVDEWASTEAYNDIMDQLEKIP